MVAADAESVDGDVSAPAAQSRIESLRGKSLEDGVAFERITALAPGADDNSEPESAFEISGAEPGVNDAVSAAGTDASFVCGAEEPPCVVSNAGDTGSGGAGRGSSTESAVDTPSPWIAEAVCPAELFVIAVAATLAAVFGVEVASAGEASFESLMPARSVDESNDAHRAAKLFGPLVPDAAF